MDNVKNDNYFLEKIRTDIKYIIKHMDGIDIEALNENEVLLDAMLFRIRVDGDVSF